MAEQIVVRLRNKANPEMVTESIQIEQTMEISHLTEYLNSINNASSEYFFYYQSDRIKGTFKEIIELFELETEETITIDYLDINDIKEDLMFEIEDYAIDMCVYRDELHILLRSGKLVKKLGDNFELSKNLNTQIRFIGCGNQLVGVKNENTVVDGEDDKVIEVSGSIDCKIHGLAVNIDKIVVGMENKKLIIFELGKDILDYLQADDFYRGLKFVENKVYWIESIDIIVEYDLKTHKKTNIYTKFVLIDIFIHEDIIYATTSENKLLRIEGRSVQDHDVSVRIADRICIYENVIILFSQYSIISIDKETYKEKFCVVTDDQINSFTIFDQKLLVSCGSAIYGYKLTRFQ